ncbi:MAG TPA: hypothetical protein PKA66_07325 [Gemmatimonadales bacterium]|nr:hypothetical protein [Gemmatimonadales bacterium]
MDIQTREAQGLLAWLKTSSIARRAEDEARKAEAGERMARVAKRDAAKKAHAAKRPKLAKVEAEAAERFRVAQESLAKIEADLRAASFDLRALDQAHDRDLAAIDCELRQLASPRIAVALERVELLERQARGIEILVDDRRQKSFAGSLHGEVLSNGAARRAYLAGLLEVRRAVESWPELGLDDDEIDTRSEALLAALPDPLAMGAVE